MSDAPDETLNESGRDPVTGRLMPGHSIGGTESPYRPEFIEWGRKLAERGLLDIEIAEFFGVSDRTLRRWKIAHQEFADALKVGKGIPDDNVERSLYQCSIGYQVVEQEAIKVRRQEKPGVFHEEVVIVDVVKHVPANGKDGMNWLKNRRPDTWRDKREHELTGKDGGAIMAQVTVDAVLSAVRKLDDEC